MTERSDNGRFQKGRSGNPKGRPRKKVNPKADWVSPLQVVFGQPVALSDGTELSAQDAAMQKALEDAFADSRKARKRIVKALIKREKARQSLKSKLGPRVEIKFEAKETRDADDAMLLLGIARRHPWFNIADGDSRNTDEQLQLESWIVQEALKRRRGAEPLRAEDLPLLKNSTYQSDAVDWPEGEA